MRRSGWCHCLCQCQDGHYRVGTLAQGSLRLMVWSIIGEVVRCHRALLGSDTAVAGINSSLIGGLVDGCQSSVLIE